MHSLHRRKKNILRCVGNYSNKKVIYIRLGDSMRKMGAICSSSNHFKGELLEELGASPNSTGVFWHYKC